MSIVTLTSDLGTADHYVAALKGAILQRRAEANIVDVSHQVPPYDIVQAAFLIENAYRHFPKGSIHVVSVFDYVESKARILIFQFEGHYFIGPDNGLFSLIFRKLPDNIRSLSLKRKNTLESIDLLGYATAYVANGRELFELGRSAGTIVEKLSLQPVITKSQMRGSVIYIDHYGNVVTNISDALFEELRDERDFALYFKRHDPICKLSSHYSNVSIGEVLCLFNSSGYLEISINTGRASDLLSLKVDDTVQIDFL